MTTLGATNVPIKQSLLPPWPYGADMQSQDGATGSCATPLIGPTSSLQTHALPTPPLLHQPTPLSTAIAKIPHWTDL